MKTCTKCGISKAISEYHKYGYNRPGVRSACKECRKEERRLSHIKNKIRDNENSKRYAEQNREKIKAYNKEYCSKPENMDRRNKAVKRNKLKFPNKVKARNIVADRTRRNVIERGTCQYPNGECRGQIEAHHEDYSKPLIIKWFCKKHHTLADKIQKLLPKI